MEEERSRGVTGQQEKQQEKREKGTQEESRKKGKGRSLTDLTGQRFGRLVALSPQRRGTGRGRCTGSVSATAGRKRK